MYTYGQRNNSSASRDSSENPERKSLLPPSCLIRVLPVFLLSIGFILYRVLYNMDLTQPCLLDLLQYFTFSINRIMYNDKNSIILLIGQLFIDITVPVLAIYWAVKIKNTRILMAFFLFNIIRVISVNVFVLPFPSDMVWHQTPVPSLLVPYDRTRDFYYSGHTGNSFILALEIHTLNLPKWVKIYIYIELGYMIVMLISCRVHYTIDVIGGIIFALFSYWMASKFLYYFDYFWSLPYLGYTKCRNRRRNDDNILIEEVN